VEIIRKDFSRNGESLSRCILETRIEKMKHLLATTELSCKEICFEAGFRREDSGAKRFREEVGMSMTKYRALHTPPQKNKLKRLMANAF
jgi:AraC-like DNA-binding protein